ncbi:MAG: hypothetical protein ACE5MB_08595, partial [Anaerolineae bacterium]
SRRHVICRLKRVLVMNETRTSRDRGVTAIRWSARLWSIASVGFVLLMFVGSALAEGFNPAQFAFRDLVGLFFFPFGVCLGMILAWRWEGLGGGMTVGSLLAFYAALRVMDGRFPQGPWFALVAAPGVLFLMCWLLSHVMRMETTTRE